VAPLRDLAPGSIHGLLDTYKVWEANCDEAVLTLDNEIQAIKLAAGNKREREARIRRIMDDRLGDKEDAAGGPKSGKRELEGSSNSQDGGRDDADGMDDMDVDSEGAARGGGGSRQQPPLKKTLLGR
jgi:hypothetical protein